MTIRVGLVGYGLAGAVFHAPLIESVEGLSLAAVVTSRAEKVARDYPQVEVVPTFERLLERNDVELIVVASPNVTHHDFARRALETGRHVVVDKPFVIHAAEADDLIDLARRQHVVLSIFQNRRWDNDFLTVRHLLASGLLGEITTYEAHYDRFRPAVQNRWREQPMPGSGTLYDLGAHLIDQALFLFGTPGTVWADVQAQRQGAQVDDYFHIVMNYEWLRVILHAGSLVRQAPPHFQLHGSKGSFVKYGIDPQEDQLKAGMRPGDAGWGQDDAALYGDLTIDAGDLEIKGRVKTLAGHYEAYYQGMVEAITQGKSAPVAPEDACNTIRVIECALQSQQEQRVIAFQE
jgi:scyllo-inositol 2-dehydrogenase (NADP+)